MTDKKDDIFDESKEVLPSWFKWGNQGDWIKGTLIEKREITSNLPGQEGQMNKVYDLKVSGGLFHDKDQEITLQEGEIWYLGGRKGIDDAMRKITIGQVVGLRYTEEIPNKQKGYNPFKLIKVYAGEMDPTYMGESEGEQEVDPNEVF